MPTPPRCSWLTRSCPRPDYNEEQKNGEVMRRWRNSHACFGEVRMHGRVTPQHGRDQLGCLGLSTMQLGDLHQVHVGEWHARLFCFVLFCLSCNSRSCLSGLRYHCGDFPERMPWDPGLRLKKLAASFGGTRGGLRFVRLVPLVPLTALAAA